MPPDIFQMVSGNQKKSSRGVNSFRGGLFVLVVYIAWQVTELKARVDKLEGRMQERFAKVQR